LDLLRNPPSEIKGKSENDFSIIFFDFDDQEAKEQAEAGRYVGKVRWPSQPMNESP
jgi:hypothetical protein